MLIVQVARASVLSVIYTVFDAEGVLINPQEPLRILIPSRPGSRLAQIDELVNY